MVSGWLHFVERGMDSTSPLKDSVCSPVRISTRNRENVCGGTLQAYSAVVIMRVAVLLECVHPKLGPKHSSILCAECQVLCIVALYPSLRLSGSARLLCVPCRRKGSSCYARNLFLNCAASKGSTMIPLRVMNG